MKRLALIAYAAALVILAGFVLPSRAAGGTVYTYAQGIDGYGGVFTRPGFAPRDYNRVYHLKGTQWTLYYCHTDYTCTTTVTGTMNPFVDPRNQGYAQAYCENVDDNSGVAWTCQTTRPS